MGVIRPPWIDKKWFSQCPFNYCDHFGDRETLATVCKICKEEIQRLELYKKAGKDPYDMKYVMKDIAESLSETMHLVTKKAKEMGIDLNNLEYEEKEAPPPESYKIFKLITKYSKAVEVTISFLETLRLVEENVLLPKAIDSLAHSQHYIIAKTGRALNSQFEEENDPDDDLYDSKTSAFLAYIAIERNSRALLAIIQQVSLDSKIKNRLLKMAKASINVCEDLKVVFFPHDQMIYEEFGCDSYNEAFKNLKS